MKKYLLLLFLFAIFSCHGRTDLESLDFYQKIPDVSIDSEREEEVVYGLLSYKQIDVQNYRMGTVLFSVYSIPEGYDYSSNNLSLFVDSYEKNNYIGFELNLVKENEAEMLIDFLTKTYGKPEIRTTNNTDIGYYWDASAKDKWLFLTQTKEFARNDKQYTNTKLVVVKNGTSVGGGQSTFSILDSFNLSYPKK